MLACYSEVTKERVLVWGRQLLLIAIPLPVAGPLASSFALLSTHKEDELLSGSSSKKAYCVVHSNTVSKGWANVKGKWVSKSPRRGSRTRSWEPLRGEFQSWPLRPFPVTLLRVTGSPWGRLQSKQHHQNYRAGLGPEQREGSVGSQGSHCLNS